MKSENKESNYKAMGIIISAMRRELHVTSLEKAAASNWKTFRKECRRKKLFIFGGTVSCDYFLKRYKYIPEYILDNDTDKAGKRYGDVTKRKLNESQNKIRIETPEILNRYLPENSVILIASINYYEEISEQLEKMGFDNYFVLCIMEAKRWNCRLYNYYLRKKKEIYSSIYDKTGLTIQNIKYILRFYHERKYPIQKNKIVFFTGNKYMDHGKYIAKEIVRQGLNWDLIWLVAEADTRLPSGIRKVLTEDMGSYIHELATAAVWISDAMFPYYVRKRRNQFYIQTKHWSSVTLKKFYFEAPVLYTFPAEIKNWKRNSRMMDCMITGSDFDTESCRSGFRYDGEIWQIGSPRSDILFRPEGIADTVYNYYNVPKELRIILYAPTYRFISGNPRNIPEVRNCNIDYEGLQKVLKQKFGGDWTVLLRLHPSVAEQGLHMVLPDSVIDASGYPDSQELIAASELMISDYSSIIFEPCYAGKPVFLYTEDLDRFITDEYGFLINIEELPFSVARNQKELERNILAYDERSYRQSTKVFLNKYNVHEDGNASKRAVEHLIKVVENA